MESYGATETRADNSQFSDALKTNDDNLLNNQNGSSGTARSKESNGGYPKSVFFILGTEFCERFSYYGMRAILILYLTKWLKFDADNATGVYHGFVFLCYFSPLFGAIIADGYLGRYRTILYLSIIYGIGNVIMSATAVPPPEWIGPMIALILIGIGTGGIKPCVAAFGADQFRPEQEKQRETFFSVFYFMINLGSMFSIILTPILRADVHCYGAECYPLAFGIPAILMISSAVIFIAGGRLYKKIPPTGNLIGRVFKCIFYGIKGKISHPDKRPHWLDHSIGLFEADFVEEVKRLLKVLIICVPLPLYWALGDQQGSRWTLQAEQLDGSMGPLGRIKPDQLQALNPILILGLIPLFEKLIYPCLDKCKVPNRPLQRMVAGMFLSVIAFVMAGFVQLKINSQFESPLTTTEIGITHYNVLPCTASVSSAHYSQSIHSLQLGEFQKFSPGNITWNISADCSTENISKTFSFIGSHSYRLVILQNNSSSLDLIKIKDQRKKSGEGNALISVMNMDNSIGSVKLVPTTYTGTVTEKTGITFDIKNHTHLSLEPESYEVYKLPKNGDNTTDWSLVSTVKLGIGGIYTLLLYNENSKTNVCIHSVDRTPVMFVMVPSIVVITVVISDKPDDIHHVNRTPCPFVMTNLLLFTSVEQNSLSMFVMVPQYIVITVGEILFSITGLSFGYSQAPKSMKSFIQAAFLMNTAFGNLIVAIISEIRLFSNQAVEFFFYAVIMLIDILIFMVIAYFYEYVRVTEEATIHTEDTSGLIDNLEMEDSYKNK
ncbi:solute carrier family 15 (oligopeptide transporter), member 1 [Mytilus galloprovincialis]|uniref:Solute carrier family 15 (Oligopeptide transporter), member 1 n=1 Tax=Mytilus galloprovincialis TaxID=29158 RepID=A0A8B6FPL2_MYTGA|nr:solute carrier family 15 (oligopeptide transporter), member 1 [Mytilus galloprovincialis]